MKKALLVAMLVLVLVALTGCNYIMEAPNTGLVVENYLREGVFTAYYSDDFDESIVEDGISTGQPYVVLLVKNNLDRTIDICLKGSDASRNANWLASGESITIKMVPGESLELYDGDTLASSYTVTTGHYVPPAKRLDVDRQETSATAQ